MSAPLPTPYEAAGLVQAADRMHTAVRGASAWRYVAWLSGMAVATLMYFTGLGLLGEDDRGVGVLSIAFGLSIAVLSLTLLPGARVSSAGFARRWAQAVLGWGVLYAAGMLLGLMVFRGELAFWLPAAVLAALPLVLGARAEARA